MRRFMLLFLASIMLTACAKKGSITGGDKDETPPEFVRSNPPNLSTNFSSKEIKIYFDEYIKLKEAQKQILISPPMDPPPLITPLGTPSRFIKIKFLDTLIKNTTYSINFGESVVDNNEENALPFFKYVFSTGSEMDSLKISGVIHDALNKKPDTYISVLLYEQDEQYTDSLVFNEVPRYVSSTLEGTAFTLDNIKEGNYRLLALKDKASNFTYQPKNDKIGFYNETVSLPGDSAKVYDLFLFKETPVFKPKKPKQASKHHFIFGYKGIRDSISVALLSDRPADYEQRLVVDRTKDSVHLWFKPFFKPDSLVFELTNGKNHKSTLISRIRELKIDSLNPTPLKSKLTLKEPFNISFQTPIESVDPKKITLMDKDSSDVAFTTKLNKTDNTVLFDFEKSEENNYNMTVLPGAFIDFFNKKNDTLFYTIRTGKHSDYGKMFVTLENVKSYPVIVQLTDKNDAIVYELISSQPEIVFENLEASKYYLRIIYDENSNGIWDTGSFLKGIQAEKVKHYPKAIDVRANWELKQLFNVE